MARGTAESKVAPGDAAATPLSEIQIVAQRGRGPLGTHLRERSEKLPGLRPSWTCKAASPGSLPGAVISDTQGNPFTQDLELRGGF